jgi:hypothetical protein
MKLIIFLSISLITVLQINAQAGNVPANHANTGTRLSLELIRTEPVPVIDSLHPDARDIPGEIVAPSGIAHPTDAEASSISPPIKAGDGN